MPENENDIEEKEAHVETADEKRLRLNLEMEKANPTLHGSAWETKLMRNVATGEIVPRDFCIYCGADITNLDRVIASRELNKKMLTPEGQKEVMSKK